MFMMIISLVKLTLTALNLLLIVVAFLLGTFFRVISRIYYKRKYGIEVG